MVTFTACVSINLTPGTLQCIAFDVEVLMPSSACDANGIVPFVRFNGAAFYFQESADLAGDVCTFVLTSPNSMVMYVHPMDDAKAISSLVLGKSERPSES